MPHPSLIARCESGRPHYGPRPSLTGAEGNAYRGYSSTYPWVSSHRVSRIRSSSAAATSPSAFETMPRWHMTDAGKDYLKRAMHHWGRAEIGHGEREAKAMKRAAKACTLYTSWRRTDARARHPGRVRGAGNA
jgi:hypothetical protein